MKSKQLLLPRYIVIANYPASPYNVGEILTMPSDYKDAIAKSWIDMYDPFPHLFRKLQWWENRKEAEMPKKLKSMADPDHTVYEISKWDMKHLTGHIKNERYVCDLRIWAPKYIYLPVD